MRGYGLGYWFKRLRGALPAAALNGQPSATGNTLTVTWNRKMNFVGEAIGGTFFLAVGAAHLPLTYVSGNGGKVFTFTVGGDIYSDSPPLTFNSPSGTFATASSPKDSPAIVAYPVTNAATQPTPGTTCAVAIFLTPQTGTGVTVAPVASKWFSFESSRRGSVAVLWEPDGGNVGDISAWNGGDCNTLSSAFMENLDSSATQYATAVIQSAGDVARVLFEDASVGTTGTITLRELSVISGSINAAGNVLTVTTSRTAEFMGDDTSLSFNEKQVGQVLAYTGGNGSDTFTFSINLAEFAGTKTLNVAEGAFKLSSVMEVLTTPDYGDQGAAVPVTNLSEVPNPGKVMINSGGALWIDEGLTRPSTNNLTFDYSESLPPDYTRTVEYRWHYGADAFSSELPMYEGTTNAAFAFYNDAAGVGVIDQGAYVQYRVKLISAGEFYSYGPWTDGTSFGATFDSYATVAVAPTFGAVSNEGSSFYHNAGNGYANVNVGYGTPGDTGTWSVGWVVRNATTSSVSDSNAQAWGSASFQIGETAANTDDSMEVRYTITRPLMDVTGSGFTYTDPAAPVTFFSGTLPAPPAPTIGSVYWVAGIPQTVILNLNEACSGGAGFVLTIDGSNYDGEDFTVTSGTGTDVYTFTLGGAAIILPGVSVVTLSYADTAGGDCQSVANAVALANFSGLAVPAL